ncbi:MAG: hypothetical protein FJZ87_14945 [Chloroflexi bacterium]|nr:hypothetical protein [Chloroflexota bacterium]
MRNIVAFPILGLAALLQSAVIGQIQLLSGYADLPMLLLAAWALQDRVKSAWHWAAAACLMVSFLSRLPWPIYLFGYLGIVFIAQIMQKRVWQAPMLALFGVTFAGTIFMHLLSFAILRLSGTPFAIMEVLGLITLPSLLLNMLFSIPVYVMMRDLSRWVYPIEAFE